MLVRTHYAFDPLRFLEAGPGTESGYARFLGSMLDSADDAILRGSMIQKLPPATHAVFVLYAVEGYKHKEIAEALGISEGTSKWHLSEARKTLQRNLESVNTA